VKRQSNDRMQATTRLLTLVLVLVFANSTITRANETDGREVDVTSAFRCSDADLFSKGASLTDVPRSDRNSSISLGSDRGTCSGLRLEDPFRGEVTIPDELTVGEVVDVLVRLEPRMTLGDTRVRLTFGGSEYRDQNGLFETIEKDSVYSVSIPIRIPMVRSGRFVVAVDVEGYTPENLRIARSYRSRFVPNEDETRFHRLTAGGFVSHMNEFGLSIAPITAKLTTQSDDQDRASLAIDIDRTVFPSLYSDTYAGEYQTVPRLMITILTRVGAGGWFIKSQRDADENGAYFASFTQELPCDIKIRVTTDSESSQNRHVKITNESYMPYSGETTITNNTSNIVLIDSLKLNDSDIWTIWTACQNAWDYMDQEADEWIPRVDVVYPDTAPDSCWPLYYCSTEEMNIPYLDYLYSESCEEYWDRAIILHEYGHHIQCMLQGYLPYCPVPDPLDHFVTMRSCPEFAFMEGFAEFFQCVPDNRPSNLRYNSQSIETNDWWNFNDPGERDGHITEGSVASVLWDIFDGGSESGDGLSFGFDGNDGSIVDILEYEDPQSIVDFLLKFEDENGYAAQLTQIATRYAVDAILYAPSNCQASENSCDDITVQWGWSGTGHDGFRVYRDGELVQTGIGPSMRSWVDNSVAPGSYAYRVSSYSDINEGPKSNSDQGTRLGPSIPPSLVSPTDGVVDLLNPVTLTWSCPSGTDECVLEIDDNSDFSSPLVSETVYCTDPDFDFDQGSPGSMYYWHLKGHNICGWGDFGATWSFTMKEEPNVGGLVTDQHDAPMADVVISVEPGGYSDVTDVDGEYEISVPFGWSGTVTPYFGDFGFDPAFVNFTDIQDDAIADFAAVSNKLVVVPLELTFNATQGQSQPPIQSLHIGSVDALQVGVHEDCEWLSISTDSGETPFDVEVMASIATLPVGEYACIVNVNSDDAYETLIEIPILAKVNYPTTGVLSFTDEDWSPLGTVGQYPHYEADSDSAYVEVTDLNMDVDGGQVDSVEVLIVSDFGDSETVYLYETDMSSGVFRGSIAFDVQVVKFVSWLRSEYPDGLADVLGSKDAEALRSIYDRFQSEGDKRYFAPEDGLLELLPGDILTVTYNDPLNDWGSPEVITDEAIYGGYAGDISGTWTSSESPYVLIGDITVTDSLIIEAGVEVQLLPEVSITVYGDLVVEGLEGDSVYFKPKFDTLDTSNYWGGIQNNFYFGSTISLSYAVVTHGALGIRLDMSGILTMSHSRISRCGSIYSYSAVNGSYCEQIVVDSCQIEDNHYNGISIYMGDTDSSLVFNSEISGNEGDGISAGGGQVYLSKTEISDNGSYGIRIGSGSVSLDSMSIVSNGQEGIYLSSGIDDFVMHYSDIHSNTDYDIVNYKQTEIDAKYNWWGDATTAEMNTGGNPKDITKIYDYFDAVPTDTTPGMVNYAGWVKDTTTSDVDLDGVIDGYDNCPFTYNPNQLDTDADGTGDACSWEEYTPPGNDVVVDLSEDITIEFDSVVTEGITELTTSMVGPNSNDFTILPGSPPEYYHISTTAGFGDSIEICFIYDGIDIGFSDEDSVVMLHYISDEWIDVTYSRDTEANQICGRVATLSPFALAVQSFEWICGDVNSSGYVDIDDIMYIIAYMFLAGPSPDPLEIGDTNCSGEIDIDDIMFLIAWMFLEGPSPCDTDGDSMPDCWQ